MGNTTKVIFDFGNSGKTIQSLTMDMRFDAIPRKGDSVFLRPIMVKIIETYEQDEGWFKIRDVMWMYEGNFLLKVVLDTVYL